MSVQVSQQQVAAIKESIRKEVTQDYLKKYIETPYIDEDRILLLISSIANQTITEHEKEQSIVATMLIQIALDTHEKITNLDEALKNRQLTVLAGDYFSSLYYKLLSNMSNVQLINILAKAIQTVNEYKVLVYKMEATDIDGFIDNLKKTESIIATEFIQFFDGNSSFVSLSEEMLLLNRLIREKEKAISGKHSILFEALINFCLPNIELSFQKLKRDLKIELFKIANRYIEQSMQCIEKEIANLPTINSLLNQRIKSLIQRTNTTSIILEEG
ncbi:heptaprenyl diphosphate synthase component 1 [Bacillus ginsengihumi]|uniref:Heptaprenyl diphosphate synthase n=1 Tax=Heyndrickxia ginsengihumi TaxID=363870 RepID=A0A0A6VE91_9BACI|nr:heptaprenyl diphosphate synthase component 1 [Heyndrickxia ginsengihumi]KHD85778.1 heptaprenyl diphosphate synthase [Heyndrickxia ginsengihumi]MBE6183479.1 heptaprenyl diphosphate synthase [Bacillus sp. (in: firmicutes)]MCM3022918.1 heptaprenyl diphosphate synthase component 1 [Heyndrickxia ginsengihumi]NEY20654.1 heptaprenyl diphosphate synthase component 1 [Heyndrickxia ginsengihumi]